MRRTLSLISALLTASVLSGCSGASAPQEVWRDTSLTVPVGSMVDLVNFSESAMDRDRTIKSYGRSWLLLPNDVLATIIAKPRYDENIPVFVAARDELARYGMDYLLVLVPGTSVVHPDALNPDHPMTAEGLPYRIDLHRLKLFRKLEEAGVNYIDLTPEFIRARKGEYTDSRMQANTHWSSIGRVIAAQKVAAWIRGREWFKEVPVASGRMQAQWSKDVIRSVEDSMERYKEMNGVSDDALMQVAWQRTVADWSNGVAGAAVQVTGDSNVLPGEKAGDCFAAQLAFELGTDVDSVGSYGNSVFSDLAHVYRAKPAEFMKRKVVVHVVSTRAFCLYLQKYYPVFPAAVDVKALKSMPDRSLAQNPVEVEATCVRISTRRTVQKLKPYRSALTCALFKVNKVLSGNVDGDELAVASWSVIDEQETTWKYLIRSNDTYRFKLDPIDSHPYLKKVATDYDALEDSINAGLYFCREFKRVPAVHSERGLFVISTDRDMLRSARDYAGRTEASP